MYLLRNGGTFVESNSIDCDFEGEDKIDSSESGPYIT